MWNPSMRSMFLKGRLKINTWRLNMNKIIQKGQESEQLKLKQKARRMITGYVTRVVRSHLLYQTVFTK